MNDKKRIAVSAIELPWHNIECIGIFDTFDEANKAAEEHIANYASITGESHTYEPIPCFGQTYGYVGEGDGDDGYEFLFLEYSDGDELYVLKEDEDGEKILGPYKSLDEANEKAIPADCDQKFEVVTGTMSMGCYPIEINSEDDGLPCVRYTPIFIYDDEGE